MTENKSSLGEKFRRFWKSITTPQSSTPNQHASSSSPLAVRSNENADLVGVIIPTKTNTDPNVLFTRVLEFSQESKGRTEPPKFEISLDKEYHIVASTICEADQLADKDNNATLLYCVVQATAKNVVFLWLKDEEEIYPSERIVVSGPWWITTSIGNSTN